MFILNYSQSKLKFMKPFLISGCLLLCLSAAHNAFAQKKIKTKDDGVAIWGKEVDTYSDGKITSTEMHEICRINKDGKVDFIKQYASVTPAAQ